MAGRRRERVWWLALAAGVGLAVLAIEHGRPSLEPEPSQDGSGSAVPLAPAPAPRSRRIGHFVVDEVPGGWRAFTGDDGRRLVLSAPPRRVVSQSLGTDHIVFAICSHDRIAAVSKLATDPKYSQVTNEARALGRMVTDALEHIVSFAPDLVLVASYSSAELVAQLEGARVPIVRLDDFDSHAAIRDNIRLVGALLGEDAAAERVVADMDARIERARARIPQGAAAPRVVSFEFGVVLGGKTTFDDAVRLAGGRNLPGEHGLDKWPSVSAEVVASWDPDVLVIGAEPGLEAASIRAFLEKNPALATTRAGRAGRVVAIPLPLMTTVSHHFAQFVEAMVEGIHAR